MNMPEFSVAPVMLDENQFRTLAMTEPGSPSATKVLEAVGATGLPGEFALYQECDEFGYRTARLVGLSLSHQGDVLLDEAAQDVGYPTAAQVALTRSLVQAQLIAGSDEKTALKALIAQEGQAGHR